MYRRGYYRKYKNYKIHSFEIERPEDGKQKLSAPKDFEVRGEIFMKIEDFIKLNKNRESRGERLFANPRNSSAGTLKMTILKLLQRDL